MNSWLNPYGFNWVGFPVGVKEMQNQSSHWLNVRKERPDWMIMWGWGAMNPTGVKEAAKIRFPMDRFIGNWWAARQRGPRFRLVKPAKDISALTSQAIGADFPALQDVIKHVVDAGKAARSPARINGW